MRLDLAVAAPPERPTVVWDGDCRFCARWIARWQEDTGAAVAYLMSQDPHVAESFPEIPRATFDATVVLVDPDGAVYVTAEAALRALAHGGRRTGLAVYQHIPGAAPLTDAAYRFVATHRGFFSWWTKCLWGEATGRPQYDRVRAWFLRGMGVIYICAFASILVQLDGLFGARGIAPAADLMAHLRASGAGVVDAPTLAWVSAHDAFLYALALGGIIAGAVLTAGRVQAPAAFAAWVFYLSLVTAGSVFFYYQWDGLLLEAGLLAALAAPWTLRARDGRPPSRIVLWCVRWLVFRLMWESGMVKILSGDATWEQCTALTLHYETQPIPHWGGWLAHQLPAWCHRLSCYGMFGIELVLPVCIFLPRRPRMVAAAGFVALMLLITATGNYGFFNFLAIVLCIALLDDHALQRFSTKRIKNTKALETVLRARTWTPQAVAALVLVIAGLPPVLRVLRIAPPEPVRAVSGLLAPLRSANGYGLFAVMTTDRPEIIVEGSMDGDTWTAYEFRYKAGDVFRRPPFIGPHMPRLDWQLWFAAFRGYDRAWWFRRFAWRLLDNEPAVTGLLAYNPFPNAPPRYIRARVYAYRFSDVRTLATTGAWWTRTELGPYSPVLSAPE